MFPYRNDVQSGYLPVVTCTLILVNIGAFLWMVTSGAGGQAIAVEHGLIPAELFSRPYAEAPTMLTSMFLHGGLFHLLGNMWFLWLFGDNVEHKLGRLGFLVFYLTAGFAAGLLQAVMTPALAIPCVGASGAVSGVMGAAALLFPKSGMRTFFMVMHRPVFITIPALYYVAIWFVGQLFWGLVHLGSTSPGIGWWAHIGGCLTGVGIAVWIWNNERTSAATRSRRRPHSGHRPEPAARRSPAIQRAPLPPRPQPGQPPPWANDG